MVAGRPTRPVHMLSIGKGYVVDRRFADVNHAPSRGGRVYWAINPHYPVGPACNRLQAMGGV